MTSTNDNGTYHLVELDGTRKVVPMAGKRIKAFKMRHKDEPDPEDVDSDDDRFGADGDPENEGQARACLLRQRFILAHTGGCAVRWGRMSWRKPSLSGICE